MSAAHGAKLAARVPAPSPGALQVVPHRHKRWDGLSIPLLDTRSGAVRAGRQREPVSERRVLNVERRREMEWSAMRGSKVRSAGG